MLLAAGARVTLEPSISSPVTHAPVSPEIVIDTPHFPVKAFSFRPRDWGFEVWGLGFRVLGFGFRVSGSGFRVSDLGFRD